jgi:hypothetical protein
LAKTYADTLSDGPSDELSESDRDDNVDNENYSDFEPDVARKLHRLSGDSESGSTKQQDSYVKVTFMQLEETVTWQEQDIIPNSKSLGRGNSGVKQIHTDCISISGDMCKHSGSQGKQKYTARKCIACKKRCEVHKCANLLCPVPPQGYI